MKSFKEFLSETQEHTSADTSLNQISAGLKYAAKKLIKPGDLAVDHGGGKYDIGKEHVEKNVQGATLLVHDPFNRTPEHNNDVLKQASGKADYIGMHNVLNVIKEPEERESSLQKLKTFMQPNSTVHITVYHGNKSGQGKISKPNKGRGSSWQENRVMSSYLPEIKKVFPEEEYNFVSSNSQHVIIKKK